MKSYKKIIISLFFVLFIFILSNSSHAMSQSLNDLYFDINILDNGDVYMTEIWDADLYDTNTLFKTFNKNERFKELSDVSVSEVDKDGNVINVFQNSGSYSYHENKGFFHACDDDSGNFEIAWGVGASGSEHRYFKINYIIKDCVKVYNDCAEYYWQIIGNQWELETDYVSGTVTLPTMVLNNEDFRVWAHGPLTGVIEKTGSDECSFSVSYMPTKTFLELRIVFPNEIVPFSVNRTGTNGLENILAEEGKFAEDANRQRKVAQAKAKAIALGGVAVSVIAGILSLKGFKDIGEKSKSANFVKGAYDFEYFRDIPDENMSPVSAAELACESVNRKNVFSSIMMSLTEKGWISITPGEKKDSTMIHLNLDEAVEEKKAEDANYESGRITEPIDSNVMKKDLTEDEQLVLNYIAKVGNSFSLKDFEKYTDKHAESFYNLLEKITKIVKNSLENGYKYYDSKNLKLIKELNSIASSDIAWMFMIPFIIMFIVASLPFSYIKTVFMIALIPEAIYLIDVFKAKVLGKKISKYTEKGAEEKAKWEGLKKFMEDFSLIDEREIPELALWEKYLVYATGFGIADKVMKQLKTRFPQLNDDSYVNSHYAIMHMASHSNLYGSSFSKSVSAAESYHAREVAASRMSSGSGGGGGFSSGGGGGRRRWWRRRPLIPIWDALNWRRFAKSDRLDDLSQK